MEHLCGTMCLGLSLEETTEGAKRNIRFGKEKACDQ